MIVADAIVETLRREGVTTFFCFPTTSMIEAAVAGGLRPVICRQERVGVHMADGFARVTNGKPVGVFAMQYGPGAENAFAGVASAYSDSTPILLLPLGHAAGASAGLSAVQFGPQLRVGDQVGRNRHAAGAHARCDATGVQRAAQRPAGAGDGGAAARRGRPRYPRQRRRVSRRPSGALGPRSTRCRGCGEAAGGGDRAPSSSPARACCMRKPATNWCGSPSCCRRLS